MYYIYIYMYMYMYVQYIILYMYTYYYNSDSIKNKDHTCGAVNLLLTVTSLTDIGADPVRVS